MQSATLTRPRSIRAAAKARTGRRGAERWALPAFAVLCLAALAGFLAYPTYPNYDSYYSLLWGRELLDGRLPVYEAYRAPTPHPLATFAGAVLAPLGHHAERAWVLLCVAAFVALVAGVYRLTREAFTPLAGVVAALLLCSRFDFPFYAARGYIDIAYMAFVVWAAVLEARRSRRGAPVLVLLAVAGLLRPEAWLMAGLYFLWVARRAGWGRRLRLAALAAVGPVVWAGSDLLVTGDLLYSLTYTSAFAEELGRSKAAGTLPQAMWEFLVKLDKLPVLAGGIVGLVAALVLVPRRMAVPFVVLAVGVGTFVLVGLGGFSVIDRYLLVTSLMVMVFCAFAVAGWTMLRPGRLRTAWMAAAGLFVAYAAVTAALTLRPATLVNELRFRGDAHVALHQLLADPAVRPGMRCGPINVPNHKLIPDVRWIEDLPDEAVLARSEALRRPRGAAERRHVREVRRRIAGGGVQIVPNERLALLRQALVTPKDDPSTVLPLPGYTRTAVTGYYAAYVRC